MILSGRILSIAHIKILRNELRAFSVTKTSSWIDSNYVPAGARPYLRLARADKQVGTLLLLWPCIWSTCLAAPLGAMPDMTLIGKFAVGAMVMRSAGCVINDLWDSDFDRQVERTKLRPIASGELTQIKALLFLGGNLSAGLVVLLSLNNATIMMGFLSMPLVVVYPLMKRFTNWPQLVLGLTFNWGALVGYTAVIGEVSLFHTMPLYLSGVCWTLIYDTIYGYQDRIDDRRIGVKSTSLYFGEKPQVPLSIVCAVMTVGLTATGLTNDLSSPYYFGVAAMSLHSLWQIHTMDINEPTNLWMRFNSNKYIGAVLSTAIVAGHF